MRAGAWLSRHAVGWLAATALGVGIATAPVRGQQDVARPPSPLETIGLYQTVERWVRAWAAPEAGEGLQPVPAASVILRLDGTVLGRGTDASGDGLTIWRAVRAALEEATRRAPVENDALRQEALLTVGQRVMISLELAGALVPFEPSSFAEAAMELAPTGEGVAVRAGNRLGVTFPGAMMAIDMDPGQAIKSALARASDDETLRLKGPGDLRAAGVVIYRFRTTHAAQVVVGEPPVFLRRGGRLVDRRSLTTEGIARFADHLAGHLIERRWPGEEAFGLGGVLHAARGRFDPLVASPAEQAAAALALHRYAGAPGVDGPTAARARAFAGELLRKLMVVEAEEAEPWATPAHASACVVAACEIGTGDAAIAALADRCTPAVSGAFDAAPGFAADLPPAARGLVAWALVKLGTRGAIDPTIGEAAVRTVYAQTPIDELAGQLPWLGWAELELAAGKAEVPAAAGLRQTRDALWGLQLQSRDLTVDTLDLGGAIVLSSTKNLLPSWDCARPLAFLAGMAGDGRLTSDEEAPAQVVRLVDSVRFLRQLTADEIVAAMYPSPHRALWGVRAALWDQRMPPDATSLTLLTATELLRSLEAIGGRMADADPGPAGR